MSTPSPHEQPTFPLSTEEIKEIANELSLTMGGTGVITAAQVGRIALGLDLEATDVISVKIREALAARVVVNAGDAFGISVPPIPPHVEARALAIPEIAQLKEQVDRARTCLGHIADILRAKRQAGVAIHAGNTAFISLERWASEGLSAVPHTKPHRSLFDHMASEHNLTLLDSELYEIERHAARRYIDRIQVLLQGLNQIATDVEEVRRS